MSLSQHISSMIVPVFLSHPQCPGQQKLVYAMLDSQSDSSFIIDQTLDNLSVPTQETVINLSTMNATLPIVCRKVDGFKVQGFGCTKNITLPTLYSRPEFPSDRTHIPSANICNKFEHLRAIASKLSKTLKSACFLDTMSATSTSPKRLCLQKLILNPTQF